MKINSNHRLVKAAYDQETDKLMKCLKQAGCMNRFVDYRLYSRSMLPSIYFVASCMNIEFSRVITSLKQCYSDLNVTLKNRYMLACTAGDYYITICTDPLSLMSTISLYKEDYLAGTPEI